jgi:hypothetical protein
MSVVELRQYTLKPGARDTLIALFEREFVESQEALGMELIGQFTDEDRPDRFVWLRGFDNMESRAKALASFYGGPVWKAHREAANATMLDSDNVLLLRPAWNGSGFARGTKRAPQGAPRPAPGFVLASICHFAGAVPDDFIAFFRDTMVSRIATGGGEFVAVLMTESSPNSFPALPVREGESVFVWFSLFETQDAAEAVPLPMAQERALARPIETLRLRPTPRSRMHWRASDG